MNCSNGSCSKVAEMARYLPIREIRTGICGMVSRKSSVDVACWIWLAVRMTFLRPDLMINLPYGRADRIFRPFHFRRQIVLISSVEKSLANKLYTRCSCLSVSWSQEVGRLILKTAFMPRRYESSLYGEKTIYIISVFYETPMIGGVCSISRYGHREHQFGEGVPMGEHSRCDRQR